MEVPDFFQGGYTHAGNTQFTPERRHSDEHFMVEDLLDFSNEDIAIAGGDETVDNITGNSTDSSAITVVDSCKSSFSGSEPNFSGDVNYNNFPDSQFEGELCVPYDDLAELEWLSNFVEESFSTDDLQKLQLYSGMKAQPEQVSQNCEFQPEPNRSTNNGNGNANTNTNNNTNTNITTTNNPIFTSDISVPGKARSKRSRAAPCNWSSRLLVLTPSPTTSSSESDIPSNSGKKLIKATPRKKETMDGSNGDGRKCLHCATDKTPQWRTGPLGPKTLCNACGVRYKSGRLVPEYRPAASPTFVLTQHSNSHRKVLELRRQKEMQRSPFGNHHHHHQYLHHNNMFNVSNGDDYLIHHHSGPDYRQLI